MSAALNAAEMPLRGRHLIEASAGTGKTFTVANLYLRLLIDTQQTSIPEVENILVVTFTNAATEELRARLRERIALALQVLDDDTSEAADPVLRDVLAPHRNSPQTRARLELAYQSMDQAAIFTIHGFCDRVLREQAFESGELFDAELQADVEPLRRRAAEAWWREHITPMSAADTETIPAGWRSPAALLGRLAPVINDSAGELVPQFSTLEQQQTQTRYDNAWQVFTATWQAQGSDWAEQIQEGVQSKSINKGKGVFTYTVETVAGAVQYADWLVQQHTLPIYIDERIALLGNTTLESSARKGKDSVQSALGECVDALLGLYKQVNLQNLVALQDEAKTGISADLAQRKLLARQRTFDDLLLQLHAVLYAENGERLAGVLRSRYPVGLIDEFQDTDRIQYEIFDKLFPNTADAASALYLIGDPKQSIYRFRGADIAMYLRARDSAEQTHSLDKNWRSSSRFINALNALYAQSEQPFGDTDIQYQPVTAGGRAENNALTVAGEVIPPLQFDGLAVDDDKLPKVEVSVELLAQRCAQRIAWLLDDGNATLGSTPLQAKDIAVLVWTHSHAQSVRQALLSMGIVCAMQSRESVFHSSEALDLLAFLRVLAKPGDTASLSRVLVSPLAAYSAQKLLEQRNDAVAWQRIEAAVQRCREQCQQAGPQAALLRFMALFNSRINAPLTVAAQRRGIDRVLGNYLHLADVLQSAWQDQPDLAGLLNTAQRWREEGADDALQLRLESDEALVQIVTVHRSKGLQYPVVMLPFACMGKDATVKGDSVAFADRGRPRLDVGSEHLADRQRQAAQALQEESLRTLYVALTRAEQSCWIGVTANKNAPHAALWRLLGLSFPAKATTVTGDCQGPINAALDQLVTQCPDIGRSAPVVSQGRLALAQSDPVALTARVASRMVQASWRVGSYTGLARGATHAIEQPDHDAADLPVSHPETPDYASPFHFPRGAEAGTLVHAVFEHLDFRNTCDQDLQTYAEQQLRAHGVDLRWVPALCRLVRNTLDTPLIDSGFSLRQLDNKDRLDELGFHFPVQALRSDQLEALLRDAGVLAAEDGLVFDRLEGYMTGFIDLTFRHEGRWYIADYKSNHLGYDSSDYHADALASAMQHHRYDLQYLLYSVALRRYLCARLPDFNSARDFGGVYYLFVRGMPGATDESEASAESPPGVYSAQPPEALLDELDQLLSGEVQHA